MDACPITFCINPVWRMIGQIQKTRRIVTHKKGSVSVLTAISYMRTYDFYLDIIFVLGSFRSVLKHKRI
jgi:hypothetical protein